MKISKFLKDLLSTGIRQVGVVLFGFFLLKVMSAALNKEYFGVFIVMRRWVTILLPLLTFNLSIGLARYVSYQKDQARFYLNISLIVSIAFCFFVFIVFTPFNKIFSKLLFNDTNYSNFVLILVFFLFANILNLIPYSYLRGKMDMNAANMMRILFTGFPLLLALALLLIKIENNAHILTLYFLIYSVWAVIIGCYYLRGEFFTVLKTTFKTSRKTIFSKSRSLFTFSLVRIPSVFFNSLILSFPALIAIHKISVVAAGYMGIVVAVLRLLAIFSMPFNMIFVPKFSALIKENHRENIRQYSMVVLDFIFTFLPLLVVIIFGLTRYIVLIWVGSAYLVTVNSVAIAILFSMFYLAFALIRGILDGLFVFPYNNFINLAGFIILALLSLLIGSTISGLSLAFGFGLLVLGLMSIWTLVKKLSLSIPWMVILKAIVLSLSVFLVLKYTDGVVTGLSPGGMYTFAICVSSRAFLAAALWFLYWRKTLWYTEVMKRIQFKASH